MNQSTNSSSNEFPDRQYLTSLIRGWENKGARDKILNEIRSLDREKMIGVLNDFLFDSDLYLQSYAINVVRVLDKQRSIDLLLPLLDTANAGVRWYICDLLSDDGDERAVEPLIKVLRDDPDGGVRLMAAAALRHIGDARAIPALRYSIEHDSGADDEGREVKRVAKEALESILRQSKSFK
jgi:HEAT repeat protein